MHVGVRAAEAVGLVAVTRLGGRGWCDGQEVQQVRNARLSNSTTNRTHAWAQA